MKTHEVKVKLAGKPEIEHFKVALEAVIVPLGAETVLRVRRVDGGVREFVMRHVEWYDVQENVVHQ